MPLFRSSSKSNNGDRFVDTYFGQLLLVFIGATISLVLTMGVARRAEKRERQENQRLSAMMVMSNIESFARTMDSRSNRMAYNDSVASWLLSKPLEELELLPENTLQDLLDHATDVQFLSHDKTAESIFSNDIETWKNIGNVQFIDCVGQCFSAMNTVEEYWNNWVTQIDELIHDIGYHPDMYEGNTIPMKYLYSDKMRSILRNIHNRRGWLSYVAATMRYHNRHNMEAIGITEEEVWAFTDTRENDAENQNPAPRALDYYTPFLTSDSLVTFSEFDRLLDSLKGL